MDKNFTPAELITDPEQIPAQANEELINNKGEE